MNLTPEEFNAIKNTFGVAIAGKIQAAFKGLIQVYGSAQWNVATFGATKTVIDAAVTTSSIILLTGKSDYTYWVSAQSSGQFDITTSAVSGTVTVNWVVLN